VIHYEAPLAPARVIALAHDMCLGLAHAHERGLVHRDLKPDNVMLVKQSGREVPRLVDFGLAIVAGDTTSRVTTGSVFFGTPAYMAPEQARADDAIDGRTDLFALGAILYEMATGKRAFEGESVHVLSSMMLSPRPSMGERVSGLAIPAALEQLVASLLDADRDKRPGSADEVARRLEAMAAGLGGDAARVSGAGIGAPADLSALAMRPTEAVEPLASGRRRIWLALAGVAVAGALVAGGAYLVRREGGAAVTQAPTMLSDAAPLPPPGPMPLPVAVDVDADVAVSEVLPPDAGARPTGKPPPVDRPRPRADAGVAQPPPDPLPDETPPPAGDVTVGVFSARYQAVGKKLEALSASKGKEVADPLRKRYFAVPFSDAMRDAALRKDAMRKLVELERDIDAALR
jgi:serine/threonine-protein kinase